MDTKNTRMNSCSKGLKLREAGIKRTDVWYLRASRMPLLKSPHSLEDISDAIDTGSYPPSCQQSPLANLDVLSQSPSIERLGYRTSIRSIHGQIEISAVRRCPRQRQDLLQGAAWQTVEFNTKVREEMQGNVHARMGELDNSILYRRRAKDLNQGIWDAMNMLNTLRDGSDPDTNMSQMEHLLQTAEAIRLDGKPEWMQVVGLDTFVVGCQFSDKIIYPETFAGNPDSNDPLYSSKFGIYKPHCGLDNVMLSWGHDEVHQSSLPPEGLAMIRYHSFYPWHRDGAYEHLMNTADVKSLAAVQAFNPYDLYSKSDIPVNAAELKPYYCDLISKFFPPSFRRAPSAYGRASIQRGRLRKEGSGLHSGPTAIPAPGKFEKDEWVESVTHDKAFLHFQLNTSNVIREILNQVHQLTHATESGKPEYGTNTSGKGKKVIIEYSSPNIAKSFHVGHLRSTIIGAFLANLYKSCGWDVISLNYLGTGDSSAYHVLTTTRRTHVSVLVRNDRRRIRKVNKDANEDPNVKVEAAKWFKRMEDGDESALTNWRVWRELSVKKYEGEYNRLNVHFDEYTGESKVGKEWQDKALERLEAMGLISDVDGPRLLTSRIGRWGRRFYERKTRTRQLWLSAGDEYAEGTVVFLDQIIKEAAQVMHEQMQKNEDKYKAIEDPENTSLEIGITGVKIQDMAAKRINNYTFNWDLALKTHEPSGVVTFAFKLSHAISSAWDTVGVKSEKDIEVARARMWMYECARHVLAAAMELLSIRPLEKM
ncbi:Arginine--tRNA ligase [Salix suchowensis]|nr:Arginine--tRNA ligase [Salix suchowensis]